MNDYEEELTAVSAELEVSEKEILGNARPGDVALARQVFYYILRVRGRSFGQIAKMLKKSKSTVSRGVALIEFERGHGGWMEGVIEGIEGRLKKVEEEG
jgi:chromosomal replication initiation ATPase DnaA